MNSKMIVKLALSSAVIAIPTAGCTSIGISSTKGMTSATKLAKRADKNARKAEKQIAKGNLDRAASYAEMAVEGDMTNAGYRSLLARVYMAQGKFKSAERTLMDVVELGVSDPRTVVSLALTRIAQGRTSSAISLIEANRSIVSESDYGLALALAGQEKRAVDVLTQAIRANGAGARVRQNLALAYALSGRWREARIMAGQDLARDSVNKQIAEWAHYARPDAYETRVAGLLGVTPQTDAGQPVRLALANTSTGLAQAAIPAAPKSSPVNLLPAFDKELAAVGPAPVATSVGFAAAEKDVSVVSAKPAMEAPLIKAQQGPVKAASKAAVQVAPKVAPVKQAKPAVKAPVKLALATVEPKPAPRRRSVAGTHIVQLGAFSSSANAKRAWVQFSSKYSVLQGFSSASSSVNVNGRKLIRLAAMGFGNKQSAVAACKSIKAQGGSCIVRSVGSKPPVRLASR
ncbi:MAG: tetratricopeptide repeat protein [Sphingorhabdus sp.]